VFYLAHFFATHPQTANTGKGMLTVVLLCLFVMLLVAVQPSLSMAMICAVVVVCMFIYGRVRVKMLLPTATASVCMFAVFTLAFPHARQRLTGFIAHPTYQVQQSLIAIGSGGLLGKGPGAGLQKFLFLPRIHNDFIFAHIAEEFGFIGGLILFFLFWQIYLRGLAVAGALDDEFSRLLVFGLNMSVFVIFLIHVGVSIGLLPPTGVPLPFISFGGWSLAANLFGMGIILQASRKRIT
jgi:cell division protein FtsW